MLAEAFRPPDRLSVAEAAGKFVKLNNPGAYTGPLKVLPYMRKPMDALASRKYSELIFVGPAQCSKTESIVLGGIAYRIKVNPMDTILYCPTQGAARDFSMRRIDRMHRNSEEIGAILAASRDADNKFDKHYKNGMMLTLSYPTVTEFAGRPIGFSLLTDYDRMDDDIGGDGSAFHLASKRGTTFGSYAMTAAESSPSRPIIDTKWIRKTPHEAPPCEGILGLYNNGDRQRRYWPCPHCGSYFEAMFEMLEWDSKGSNADSGDTVRLLCPHCGEHIHMDDRDDMDMWGEWICDGQTIDNTGRVHGEAPRTSRTSFWLNGVAAYFVKWNKLVEMYLNATDEFERTGSDEALKKFYNNDLGVPYTPKGLENERLPEVLKSRAEPLPTKPIDEPEKGILRVAQPNLDPFVPLVPEGVLFLIATVDVQKNSFIVQIFGVLEGNPFDLVLVDRFTIRKSLRTDADGDAYMVRPGAHLSDWDRLVDLVMLRRYELCDGSGREMQIKLTVCDSGGEAGVTTSAYNFVRRLRYDDDRPELRELSGRFHLVKGVPTPGAPRAHITFPDSNRKDQKAVARGDVPVLMLQSNQLKDVLANRLADGIGRGQGQLRFPNWLDDTFWVELCEEVRDSKGWQNPNSRRNEAWDLSYYVIGACVSTLVRIEVVDWTAPPEWARGWDENPLVLESGQSRRFARSEESAYDFSKLGKALA